MMRFGFISEQDKVLVPAGHWCMAWKEGHKFPVAPSGQWERSEGVESCNRQQIQIFSLKT